MISKAIFGIILASLSLYLVWYKFGENVFKEPLFLLILMVWVLYGFVFFLDELGKSDRKTTDEKVDELINKLDELIAEIKTDRGAK